MVEKLSKVLLRVFSIDDDKSKSYESDTDDEGSINDE